MFKKDAAIKEQGRCREQDARFNSAICTAILHKKTEDCFGLSNTCAKKPLVF